MKFRNDRPYNDSENAASELVEIANSVETAQQDRIFIELVNYRFLSEHKCLPAQYKAKLDLAIARLALEAWIRDLREVHPNRRGVRCAGHQKLIYVVQRHAGNRAWRGDPDLYGISLHDYRNPEQQALWSLACGFSSWHGTCLCFSNGPVMSRFEPLVRRPDICLDYSMLRFLTLPLFRCIG